MFCESYRQPLKDAAASAEALPRSLELHVAGCQDCAESLAAEQAVLVAIQRSLHAAMNAEIPASLITRVRVAIPSDTPAAKPAQWIRALVPLMATVVVASFLMIPRFRSQRTAEPVPQRTASNPLPPADGVTGVPHSLRNRAPGVHPIFHSRTVSASVVSSVDVEAKIKSANEMAMLQLIQMAREQPDAARAIFANTDEKAVTIKPIDVAELAWAPLASDADAKN
jgi:hypothetical protein